jgi:hypothetical protein
MGVPSDTTFSSEQGTSIQQTDDGGFIVTGWIKANIDTIRDSRLHPKVFEDVLILKFDPVGDLMTGILYDGLDQSGETIEEGYSVQQTTDGGYIFVGATNCWVDCDVWVLKTDADLEVEWGGAKAIDPLDNSGQRDNDIGYSVQEISDGYIITGVTNCWDDCDVLLLKIVFDGNMVWRNYFGGPGDDRGYSVQATGTDGYIITGYAESEPNDGPNAAGEKLTSNGGRDVYLIKTDELGNQQWAKLIGGGGNDEGHSVQLRDGGYMISGYTESYGNGQNDVYIIKIKTDGTTLPVR